MINVLSCFDGLSGGQLALERSGIKVNQYFASEIDKYAIKITQKNFPDTIQLGDVCNVSMSEIGHVDINMVWNLGKNGVRKMKLNFF